MLYHSEESEGRVIKILKFHRINQSTLPYEHTIPHYAAINIRRNIHLQIVKSQCILGVVMRSRQETAVIIIVIFIINIIIKLHIYLIYFNLCKYINFIKIFKHF